MQLRTITRLSAAGFAICLVAGGVLTVLAPNAGATGQARITILQNESKEVIYPALVGEHVVPQVDTQTGYSTDVCDAVTSCDAIPLTIGQPVGISDIDEYYVTIRLEWDTENAQNVPVTGTYTVNDLDMYMTNDPVVPDAGPDTNGFVYHSAGTDEPEIIQMFKPAGDYMIFVGNASGVNTGYRLKITWSTDVLPNPFESLPPSFSQTGSVTPKPLGGGATPTPLPSSGSTGGVDLPSVATPSLATPGIAAPDTSFDSGFSDAPALDQEIAGPPVHIQNAAVVKAAPPSSLALLLWMIALPLGLVALGGGLLMRRSQNLLVF